MSELKNYPVLRFLKGATNFIWYFVLIVCGITLLMILGSLIPGFDEFLSIENFKAPVVFRGDGPYVHAESTNPDFRNIEIRVLNGDLSMNAANPAFWILMTSGMIIWIAMALFILYQIKKIFGILTVKHPFEQENIKRIRIIGFTVIVAELLNWFLFFIMNLIYSSDFITESGKMSFGIDRNITAIFAGLAILVIAEIFRVGFEMRKEHELTI
ncbi:DUF2975 domain-containing protein [candidate division KSB1 bacterium]